MCLIDFHFCLWQGMWSCRDPGGLCNISAQLHVRMALPVRSPSGFEKRFYKLVLRNPESHKKPLCSFILSYLIRFSLPVSEGRNAGFILRQGGDVCAPSQVSKTRDMSSSHTKFRMTELIFLPSRLRNIWLLGKHHHWKVFPHWNRNFPNCMSLNPATLICSEAAICPQMAPLFTQCLLFLGRAPWGPDPEGQGPQEHLRNCPGWEKVHSYHNHWLQSGEKPVHHWRGEWDWDAEWRESEGEWAASPLPGPWGLRDIKFPFQPFPLHMSKGIDHTTGIN